MRSLLDVCGLQRGRSLAGMVDRGLRVDGESKVQDF